MNYIWLVMEECNGLPDNERVFPTRKSAERHFISRVNEEHEQKFESFGDAADYAGNNWGEWGIRIWEIRTDTLEISCYSPIFKSICTAIFYPNQHDLDAGCRFYPDEAFQDEPNGCDTCDKDAEYMTCPDGEDYELYICKRCVKRFSLEDYVDDK